MQTLSIKNFNDIDMFKLKLLEDEHILYSEWIGFINDIPMAKESCLAVVDKIEETKVHLLLNDNRQQEGPWPTIDDWLQNVWIPAMSKAGLKYFAHIHSKNIFTKFSASNILSEVKNGIEFRHFDNEKSAKDWLLSHSKNL